ncbi:hypothetical protein Tsubulata_032880 [Turnera subulata]|uniref:Uncharacterized protein n=1 Tax=Turnera subulata TaxID=218843 RepID=A0A9Q0FVA7_9ROSI|nr:hypothetical protein Tsubulata_032880 [Turnera subulata]
MCTVAAAAAQRGGGVEDDVVPEHHIEELPCALSGYTLLHLSRPLVPYYYSCAFLLHIISNEINWGPVKMAHCIIIKYETESS